MAWLSMESLPFWGLRTSSTSMPAISLMNWIISSAWASGIAGRSCATPSMTKITRLLLARRAQTATSLARRQSRS